MNWNENIETEIAEEMNKNLFARKRYGVKITRYDTNTVSSDKEILYYNIGFNFSGIMRWKWYFQWRCAKSQVETPRKYCQLDMFSYEVVEAPAQEAKRRKDIIAARRRKVTIARMKLEQYKKDHRGGLFPIEQDPKYIEAIETVSKYETRLSEIENS